MAQGRTRRYGPGGFPKHFRFKNVNRNPPPKVIVRPPTSALTPTVPFPSGLVVFSSGKERCGINEYSKGLDARMREAGAAVSEMPLDDMRLLASAPAGAEVLIHAEPCLFKPGFNEALQLAYKRKAKIVVCFHHCDAAFLQRLANSADVLVTHRDYGIKHPKIRIVPLAAPMYQPTDQATLRRKYGLPENKTILTTLGFLVAWKKMSELVQHLLPLLEQRGMLLQILSPIHFSGDPSKEAEKLRHVVAGRSSVLWQSSFLPEQEVLERVNASDLGLMYHGQDTGSCSAASKAFVSARRPLLVTSSNHDSDIQEGADRIAGFDLARFAQRAVDLAQDRGRLAVLQAGMERDYARMNQAVVARRYLELFKEIRK